MSTSIPAADLAKISALQSELDELRKKHGISSKGDTIWFSEIDFDRFYAVTADGLGGATLIKGRGEIHSDFLTMEERVFSTESLATTVAAMLMEDEVDEDDAFDAEKLPESGIEREEPVS